MGQKLQPELGKSSKSSKNQLPSSVTTCKQLSSQAQVNESERPSFQPLPNANNSKSVKITVETEGTTQAFIYQDFDQFHREFTPRNFSRARPLTGENHPTSVAEASFVQCNSNNIPSPHETLNQPASLKRNPISPKSLKRARVLDDEDNDNDSEAQSSMNEPMPQLAAKSLYFMGDDQLTSFLEDSVSRIRQVALKTFLKMLIKLIEPHKQKKWPYYLGDLEKKTMYTHRKKCGPDGKTRPPWWPPETGFERYKEPDHLTKNECQPLAVHLLLWLLKDPQSYNYQKEFNNMPIKWIREEFQKVKLYGAEEKPNGVEVKQRTMYIHQMFNVAQKYEHCRLGYDDGTSPIQVLFYPDLRKRTTRRRKPKDSSTAHTEDLQPQKRRRKEIAQFGVPLSLETQSGNIREQGEDIKILADVEDDTTTDSPASCRPPDIVMEDPEAFCDKDSNVMLAKPPLQLKPASLRENNTFIDSNLSTYDEFTSSLDPVFPMPTYNPMLHGFASNTDGITFDQNVAFTPNFMPQLVGPTLQYLPNEDSQIITAYHPIHFTHTIPP